MKNKILSVIFITFIILVHAKIPIGNKQPDKKKPNIIFIAVDDMNDWVGYLGGHCGMKIHTPNIDRLAKASMIFTNAHTPSPACAPARAAILSGVHHTRSGIQNTHWGDGPKWREFPGLENVETLEQFLKKKELI